MCIKIYTNLSMPVWKVFMPRAIMLLKHKVSSSLEKHSRAYCPKQHKYSEPKRLEMKLFFRVFVSLYPAFIFLRKRKKKKHRLSSDQLIHFFMPRYLAVGHQHPNWHVSSGSHASPHFV